MRRRRRVRRTGIRLSMTGWLIAVNVVASIFGFLIFASGRGELVALKPSSILAGQYLWTLITHMFMHGGIFHLLINMFVLFSLGGLMERIIGRKRFFWFYIISGVFAGLLTAVLAGLYGFGFWERVLGSSDIFMVGASGAIFAVAGLFAVLLPKIRFAIIFFPFFSLPGWIMIPLVLFITWGASIAAGLPIGNVAHFGGFIFGLAYGWYLRRRYSRKVQRLQRYFR